MDVSAAEVYLVHKWHSCAGEPDERRRAIFHDFVALGQVGRWSWLKLANGFIFNTDEREIVTLCRTPQEMSMMDWLGQDLNRLLFVKADEPNFSEDELDLCTDMGDMLVCEGDRYVDGNPFDFMPELVYSLTAADDPQDVLEEQWKHPDDQSLLVTGVFWIYDGRLTLVWCDEYGRTLRKKEVDRSELKEVSIAFSTYKHFDSRFWLEAEICHGGIAR